jgi:hypothetical protein
MISQKRLLKSLFLMMGLVCMKSWSGVSTNTVTQAPQPTFSSTPPNGTVAYIDTNGYYPAIIFEGNAAEMLYNSLALTPYQSNDGTLVKSGPNIVCARATKMEGIDEVVYFQCFESVPSNGTVHPAYVKKTPGVEPPEDECKGRSNSR